MALGACLLLFIFGGVVALVLPGSDVEAADLGPNPSLVCLRCCWGVQAIALQSSGQAWEEFFDEALRRDGARVVIYFHGNAATRWVTYLEKIHRAVGRLNEQPGEKLDHEAREGWLVWRDWCHPSPAAVP